MSGYLPFALLGWLALPGGPAAAPADSGVAAPARAHNPDFLFEAPRASLTLRAGLGLPRAGSDIYEFFFDEFTLSRRDLREPSAGLDLGIVLGDRLDALVGIGYGASSTDSEYWDWEGEDGLPIRQTTRLSRLPVTAGLRLYMLPRGRSIGRFAWVPARFAPYVAGGVGLVHYRLEQSGEFVDFEDLAIFTDRFTSSGWAPAGHVAAGADYRVGTRTALTVEARQLWASADLDRGFDGFEPIDLAGLRLTLGLTWRL